MKKFTRALVVFTAFLLWSPSGVCGDRNSKLVTRIETAAVVMKRGRLVIRVEGKATTPSLVAGGGRLVRHGQDHAPNKEGLLEYDLVFNAPADYSGFKLRPVKATLKESSTPPGVLGVRIFAEYNHLDAMLPAPKQKK
jgi:hypothetical protein